MKNRNITQVRPLALVLGATGGIGGAVARRLSDRGWNVRAMNRNPVGAQAKHPQFEWVHGDAMNAADVLSAAEGASLIVHAVNPPGYKDWDKLVLPMLDNTIAAARIVGARVLLPGTVYNYGPDAFLDITEESPQNPVTRKGAIRVEMERRLRRAADDGVPALIVRAGDFFGPGAANSWFSQGLIKMGKPVRSVTQPGKTGIGHQWAYLPDVAETMVRLIEQADRLPSFAQFNMEGVWDPDGRRMIRAIERVVQQPLKVGAFPWWSLLPASPFVPFMRELREMRYLWQQPVRMRNERLRAFLGSEPSTPLDLAVEATLRSLGCLDERSARATVNLPVL
ncbi:SDR family oxidoreductase [Rhizobium oryzicola]|uniref:SDR family oxidoreductase n=1 Tax=Rhizobium oryzicola TaxID=1232668 RepID=A0ABT8SVA7_9HYPH|nr:SDR family oxidoreductase [Rhizobium oryzicola]MDO1582358.1 SDR family oxidoreductase [Rhizobium oryzicola]